MSGGLLTIRGSPSTTWVSLPNTLRLSCARALATLRSKRLRAEPFTTPAHSRRISSTSSRAYQMSNVGIRAKTLMASR